MSKSNGKQVQSMLLSFRRAFTIIVVINLIFLIERSIFDFMGFMFGMIIADVFYLIFLIIGLFGAYQYRVNYVAMLTILTLVWIAWNIFIICNYLNIGLLDRYDPVILNLNTGKKSWWFTNSIGCKIQISNELEQLQYQQQLNEIKMLIEPSTTAMISINKNNNYSNFTSNLDFTNFTSTNYSIVSNFNTKLISTTTSPSTTTPGLIDFNEMIFNSNRNYTQLDNFVQANCFLPFYFIEIAHSAIQILVAILCIIFGILLSNAFNEDDDAFDYIGGFDTVHIISNNFNNQDQPPTLPRSGQIRLEPIYVYN